MFPCVTDLLVKECFEEAIDKLSPMLISTMLLTKCEMNTDPRGQACKKSLATSLD